jgi:uncharacterized protein YyaL (SSP411 family)
MLAAAIENIQFLEQHLQQADGSLLHTYKNGEAKIMAFLDDYAYLIQTYIQLQEVTGNDTYLLKAKALTTYVLSNFRDSNTGLFYFTNRYQTDIIFRKKEIYDGAIPSGNAIMAANLFYLSIILDYPDWKIAAEKMLISVQSAVIRYPTSFGNWALLMQTIYQGVKEIAIIGDSAIDYLSVVLKKYVPNSIIQTSKKSNNNFPMLQNRGEVGRTCLYLCEKNQCYAPQYDVLNFLTIN